MKRQVTNLSEFDLAQIRRVERRLQDIEQLLLANFKHDVNGAPLNPPELDPTSSDVIRTIKMAFEQSGMTFKLESLNYSGSRAWSEFNYGTHRYVISVERESYV